MEGEHKDHKAPHFSNPKSAAKLNIMTAFTTAHQIYLTTIIKMVKSQALLIVQPIGSMNASYTSTVRQISESHNLYGFTNSKALQSEHLIDSNCPCDNYHQYVHYPSITLTHQETAHIDQLRLTVNEASLLTSVMVEQPFIQVVISSVETFDGTEKVNPSHGQVPWKMQHKFQERISCT